jgi:sugar phosphate isomerase/epimerase
MFEAIGIKNAVLHIDPMDVENTDYRERIEKNVPKLRELIAKISHVDITLCLENLCVTFISIEDILEVIERVGSDKLGICLDTGHLNILKANTQGDFIRKAGKYLKALHVHDNDGSADQHLIPFARGKIDFKDIVTALRDIDYDGLFNFEIPGDSHKCPIEIKHAKVQYVRAIYDYLMKL